MELKFTVGGRISKPVAEVFEAVVDPAQLSEFFTTGGARGRIEAGAEVTWDFHDFPGAFPVLVQEVVPNEKVVLQWEAGDDARTWTTVTITFQELEDGRTYVRINEFGWPGTETGLKSCLGNCEGWTGMLCAMKVWLENGIRLRDGFYKQATRIERELEMEPGKNIAIKVPLYRWDETVAFYRDKIGLQVTRELKDSTGFSFGPMTLWIDRVPHQSQTDVWIELFDEDPTNALATLGSPKRDELEPLTDVTGHWTCDPAGTVILLRKGS